MNLNQAQDILLRIVSAYPRFDLTEPQMRAKIWTDYLMQMPYEKVLARLNKHIIENAFAPSIAEIAVKEPVKSDILEKQKRWEAEVNAERARKLRS